MNTSAAGATLSLQNPPVPPPRRLTVAYTTPSNYADRLLSRLILHLQKPNPPNLIWTPTVVVESTLGTTNSIKPLFTNSNLEEFSAIAFTSRTGITAISDILKHQSQPLSSMGHTFTVSALGIDTELLDSHFISKLCPGNPSRIEVLVPPVATPTSLAESLGFGLGRKVMCPVPQLIGLTEPTVVPNFLQALAARGWVPIRASAYETRWAGPNCAAPLMQLGLQLDAIVFTSTAEVEGLLKSLRELGFEWDMLRKRWPQLLVAAHGPITAAGANGLGLAVDVVGSKFGSFDGIAEALAIELFRRNYYSKELQW
ncbi:hypothetical protein ACHQM5_020703 [Ranunculus cassubicifolius]